VTYIEKVKRVLLLNKSLINFPNVMKTFLAFTDPVKIYALNVARCSLRETHYVRRTLWFAA